MIKVHSFDVFDTCLVRRVGVPSDVFYNVAERAFARLGITASRQHIEDFVAVRVNAERNVREQSTREDITLADIWRNLSKAMDWSYDDSLALCELNAEEEVLAPVSAISKKVQAAREQGCRIVFLSDMYLPKDFITKQLVNHGFARAGDGVYVSGDLGKTKATGNLFRHLMQQEKVAAPDICHTGDHPESDYKVPRQMGIRAELFTQAKLTRAETDVMLTSQESRCATRIAGAMRAARLGLEKDDRENVRELSSQFVAPFVIGFATWVLRRAQADGIKRLYFLSRDCQLTWKVARELSPQFGGIDCRYLYVSRQALFLPSANGISFDEMPWMQRFFEEPTLDRLLAKIELKYADVEDGFRTLAGEERGAYRLKSEKDWSLFWEVLNQEPAKARVTNLIATRREAARRYFESAGLFDPVPWAVVDLGWYLTCQQSLWKLLRQTGWEREISGYYIELSQRRVNRAAAGNAQALFYQGASDYPRAGLTPLSNATLLEHVLGCADHPTVHHYETGEDGSGPAFAKKMDPASLEFCRKVQGAVLGFVSNNRTLPENFADTTICRDVLESLVTSFVRFPTKGVADSLQELSAACDQNNSDALQIAKPLNLVDALFPILPKRKPFNRLWKREGCVWPEGTAATTSPAIKRVAEFTQRIANLRAKMQRAL